MSSSPETPQPDEEALERERAKASALAESVWWKNRLIRGRCHLCGGEFSPAQIVMDFKVALNRGGRAERGNAVPACRSCQENREKLTPLEWEEYLRGQGWDPDDDDGNGE
jgi:5-methylcytosine-specific restriction endonuclease McrA